MTEFSVSGFAEVRPGVWRAVAQPAAVNIGLLVGSTGALIVDTGSSPSQGEQVREAAEALTGLPVIAAVVTHAHWDHLFGLAAFDDVRTLAHHTVSARTPEQAAEAVRLGVDPDALVEPNTGFALAKTVDLGGLRAELVHFGPGHTPGDVVVIVPQAKVVFAGDLLEESAPPSFGPDCTFKGWPSAVDGILGVLGEDWLVIPGHGEPFDRMYAFNQRAQISGLYGQVEWLYGRGVGLDRAYEQGEWPFPEEIVRALLPAAYAELATSGSKPARNLPLI